MTKRVHPIGGDRYASLPAGVQPIRQSLGELSTRFGLAPPATLHQVFADWATLVGEPLATHVRPTTLRDGMLRLMADESAWATQVKYLGQELIDRINERLGGPVVRELAVSVRGVRRRGVPATPAEGVDEGVADGTDNSGRSGAERSRSTRPKRYP